MWDYLKSSISIFQEFFPSIDKIFILKGGLSSRLADMFWSTKILSLESKHSFDCLLQHADFNMPTSTCLLQHVYFNMPSSTCLLQHAYFNIPTSTCPLQHAYFNMPASTCLLQHAYFNMPTSTCLLQHAYFNMPASTCLLQHKLFARKKIIGLREILRKTKIDVLCIDKTKLDSSFPNHQFKTEGYQFPPLRRDRNSKGGGKLVFVREGFIAKQMKNFEMGNAETMSWAYHC